jgi:hypothetical protein
MSFNINNISETNNNTNAIRIYPAQSLTSNQRKNIALMAAVGGNIKEIAKQNKVSRNFVYEQQEIAIRALDVIFSDKKSNNTKTLEINDNFIKKVIIAASLMLRGSEGGIVEFLKYIFDHETCRSTVNNVLHEAIRRAAVKNREINLANILAAAADEIFQANMPILTMCDMDTGFIALLSLQQNRDSITWCCRWC